jgi:ATP-dependent RNA helicase DDX19/DBP5
VLARGFDYPEVDLVINFDIPIKQEGGWRDADIQTYIHRIGRTARFGTDGIALTFVERDQDENEAAFIEQIEMQYPKGTIKTIDDIDDLSKIYNEMRSNN